MKLAGFENRVDLDEAARHETHHLESTLVCPLAVLQIRRGERNNLGIIVHITPLKHML